MRPYVLSLSYGNYLIQNGGTDKVIREHCKLFNDNGYDYLFVFPVVRTFRFAGKERNFRCWGVDLNKKFVGIFTFPNLLKNLRLMQTKGALHAFFIHHTWRVNQEEVLQLCEVNDAPIYYYLHDFQSICSNRNFIDDTGKFCGCNKKKCVKTCSFYNDSNQNRHMFCDLFNAFEGRIQGVAPSENTKQIFKLFFNDLDDRIFVHEHQKCTNYRELINYNSEKIKIAYIGSQVSIKGWEDFKKLKNLMEDKGYELYYLGTGNDIPDGVKHIEVSVCKQGNTAMQDALRNNSIDVVLLLSIGPETYSYTYYESYAAGCYILTYSSSGNMADQVRKNKNGQVFENYSDIEDYILNATILENDLIKYRNSKRKIPSTLLPNDTIVKMVVNGLKSENTVENICLFSNKSMILECIYRIQNRGKLDG